MNTAHIGTVAVLSFVAVWNNANAGDNHYECAVVSALKITEQGSLLPHWSHESLVGAKFTVDRITGRIIGGPLDNANFKTEVIDKGSRETSFQAFSRSTQKSHTAQIEIQEFASGLEKPFVGFITLSYPGVYSGI